MMQALGFPNIKAMKKQSREDRLGDLMLFWGVWASDQSLAMAFNRAANLPISICDNVPFPTLASITNFNPHTPPAVTPHKAQPPVANGKSHDFGARFFVQALKLCMVIGKIVDMSFNHTQRRMDKTLGSIDSEVRLGLRKWLKDNSSVRSRHLIK